MFKKIFCFSLLIDHPQFFPQYSSIKTFLNILFWNYSLLQYLMHVQVITEFEIDLSIRMALNGMSMILGLLFVTEGGNYVLKMVDSYASGWNVIILCLLETTAISYIYGYNRFAKVILINYRIILSCYCKSYHTALCWAACHILELYFQAFITIFHCFNFSDRVFMLQHYLR